MSRTIANTTTAEMFAQTTPEAFLYFVEISHSSFDTIRIVNNTTALTYNSNSYTAYPFMTALPPDTEDLQYRSVLRLTNVPLTYITQARTIAGSRERAAVRIDIVMAGDLTAALSTVSGLQVDKISYNSETIEMSLTIDNFLTEPWPGDSFLPSTFPGLF